MSQKLANVLEGLAQAINDAVDELRDVPAAAPQAGVGREVHDDRNDGPRVAYNDPVTVKAGDLWRLVNRTRKMIRLAREGKIPDMEARAPLCRSIKGLKEAGAIRKPYDLRD